MSYELVSVSALLAGWLFGECVWNFDGHILPAIERNLLQGRRAGDIVPPLETV